MKTTVVRYEAKPERADENQQLVEAVFGDLRERQPVGFSYQVFRLEDGVTFVHVGIEQDDDNPATLPSVPAFRAFVAEHASRCAVSPVAMSATRIGDFH